MYANAKMDMLCVAEGAREEMESRYIFNGERDPSSASCDWWDSR